MTIYEKLQKVQNELNVPKEQYNSFGKYSYRSCEDILEAVKPLLNEAGAVLIVGDELVQMDDHYYIKATARFIDIAEGTEITNTAYAREPEDKKGMDSSQVTGATSSYARKYALAGLLCLDDEKDADTMDNTVKSSNSAPTAKKTAEKFEITKVRAIEDELARTGVSKKSLLDNYRVKDLNDLSLSQFKDAMDKLTAKPAKAKPPMNPPEADSGLPWNQEAEKPAVKSKREQVNEQFDSLFQKGGKFE